MLAGVAYLAARFYFWPRLDAMATERVVSLERQLGARVRWSGLDTDWQGLRPTFELRDLVIGDGEAAVRAGKINGTLSLQALLSGQWGLHDLRIDRPMLTLARQGGHWRVAALPYGASDAVGGSGAVWPAASDVSLQSALSSRSR